MANGYGQIVFAGDGDDLIDLGDNWTTTGAYGGSGNDTFNLPVLGDLLLVDGGDGDDVFDTDRDQDPMAAPLGTAVLYGGAGNDKITLPENVGTASANGGDGDDKITYSTIQDGLVGVAGDDGSDIIYGTDGYGMGTPKIYGDYAAFEITANPDLAGVGGDDKIYGGNGLKIGSFQYSGGPGSDLISIGSDL